MTALFDYNDKMPIKTVHFGAVGYVDYTVAPHDEEKKDNDIQRHQANETWNDCTTTGALSKLILWANKI